MRVRYLVSASVVLSLMLVTIVAASAQGNSTEVPDGPIRANANARSIVTVRSDAPQSCTVHFVPDPEGPSRNPEFTRYATKLTGHQPTFRMVDSITCTPLASISSAVSPNNVSTCPSTAIDCLYLESNYRGGHYTDFDPSNSSCVLGGYATAWVGSAMNDIISSVSTGTLFGCQTTALYRDINFGGAVVTCNPDCATLGTMDDQISSYWTY